MNQDQQKTAEKNDIAPVTLVVFQMDEQRYALPLSNVERIIRMVEIAASGQGDMIGTINVGGENIPVIDLRSRFGLPGREKNIHDQIIIAAASNRRFAYIIDRAVGVIKAGNNRTEAADDIFPGLLYIKGILKQDDGMIHVIDPETILCDPVNMEESAGGDV